MTSPHQAGVSEKTLGEIRERAEKATPGPWTTESVEADFPCIPHAHHDICRAQADVTVERCEPGVTDATLHGIRHVNVGCYLGERPDAEFIAHARTDVPALLGEIARLRAALDEYRRTVRRVDVRCGCGNSYAVGPSSDSPT